MKRWAQWTGGVVVFAILGMAALYAASSLRGATAGQRAALALMEQPDDAPGSNAFAALWLLPHAVPEGGMEAVADEDVRRYTARAPIGSDAAKREGTFVSVAAARYPVPAVAVEALQLCTRDGSGCLALVRSQPDAYQRWRGQNIGWIERAGAIPQYGHYRGRFEPGLAMPLPPLGALMPTLLTDRALSFVEGRRDVALAQVCGDVTTWRRLAPRSDSLVVSMVGHALAGSATQLFAAMLAELPAGYPLPPACGLAFAPATVADVSLCEPLKGEFRLLRTSMAKLGAAADGPPGVADNALFSGAMTEARSAQQMARFCGKDVERALVLDRPVLESSPGHRAQLECVRNYVGCILADIAAPAYRDYVLRAQDHGAKLQLAGTVAWLHENPDDMRPLAARVAARPVGLRSASRDIEVVEDGRALRVAMYGRRPAGHFQLPLAAHVAGATSGG